MTTKNALVYRVLSRSKFHDFWIVSFMAFDLGTGEHFMEDVTFRSAKEAFALKPGNIIPLDQCIYGFDMELPF